MAMKMPSDWRPVWRGGVLQIHITRACDLSCCGCTQGSNLAGKPVMMSVSQFETAVKSVVNYPGVIGIFGGNPCIHPGFADICKILEKYIPFEQRGLWSNNLNGHGRLCREIFNPEYSNLNVHCSRKAYEEMKREWPESKPKGLDDSRHSPPYVAMRDMEDLDNEDRWRLIHQCDINQNWSAMICVFRNQLRAFFCELAGAQSMLHETEPDYPDTGHEVVPDWWLAGLTEFIPQISKHCMDCGIPLKGFGSLAIHGDTEFVSKTHLNIYRLKRPVGKTIKLVTRTDQLGGSVKIATNYCENGYLRMAEMVGM